MKSIHVLRKPCSEQTVAANVFKHGTGALNIDATRIDTSDNLNGGAYAANPTERWDGAENWRYKRGEQGNAGEYQQPTGRWPANLILQHLDGCVQDGGAGHPYESVAVPPSTVAAWICAEGCPVAALDAQSGMLKSGTLSPNHKRNAPRLGHGGTYGNDIGTPFPREWVGDEGGASRFFKQFGGGA